MSQPGSSPPLPTEEIFRRSCEGDSAASTILVQRMLPFLRAVLSRRLTPAARSLHDTEDIALRGLERALQNGARFAPRGAHSFRRWLRVVVGRELISVLRETGSDAKTLREEAAAMEVVDERTPDPSVSLEDRELQEHLRGALSGLTDEEQTLVRMRYFENSTYRYIASQLGIGPGTVAREHARVIQKLMTIMSTRENGESGDGW